MSETVILAAEVSYACKADAWDFKALSAYTRPISLRLEPFGPLDLRLEFSRTEAGPPLRFRMRARIAVVAFGNDAAAAARTRLAGAAQAFISSHDGSPVRTKDFVKLDVQLAAAERNELYTAFVYGGSTGVVTRVVEAPPNPSLGAPS